MLEKLFKLKDNHTTVRTEVLGGITTFMTMAYILAVNPDILSTAGMDKGAVFTATALASAVGTLLIAFLAKLPFAQAPSMGINAFFAFTLVMGMGYSWQAGLAAVFVEGVIFILLTAFNIREQIVRCIPKNLRFAISAGIGFFIAFIGLKNAGHRGQRSYLRSPRPLHPYGYPRRHRYHPQRCPDDAACTRCALLQHRPLHDHRDSPRRDTDPR